MKIACIQMNISLCSKEKNLEHALSLAEEAVSKDAEMIVFPEVFSTGFCYDCIGEVAETVSGPTLEALRSFSKEYGCILAGSIIEKLENDVKEPGLMEREGKEPGLIEREEIRKEKQVPSQYNLGFCIESGKLAGTHRKTQLYGPEKEHFAPGNRIAPIRLEKHGLTIGLIVCNELRYPEVARKLALEGADILVSSAEIPDFFGYPWRIISLARALENQLPHVACTRVGKDLYSTYLGGSFISDGWGCMLAEAGKEECVLIGEIDLEKAKETRETTSIFGDRRPELY